MPSKVANNWKLNLQKNKFSYTLSTGDIVNTSGIYKTNKGFITDIVDIHSEIEEIEIEKALIFIDKILEKRNYLNKYYSSYTLKHLAENFSKHYISNGAFIIALDIKKFKIGLIKEDSTKYSLNIYTNYKTLPFDFEQKLKRNKY